MSGHVPKLYFVTINVNSNSGLDIMQFMQKLNALLDDYRNATQVLYKFKVTGESKVVAVIKVTNEIGFERTIGGLARIGNLSVTTVPVTALDTYAQRLGINTHNIYNHQQIFPKDNIFYWAVDLQFSGISLDEFLMACKRDMEFLLSTRLNDGFPVECFKVSCEYKLHYFMQMKDHSKLDQLSFRLPILNENGINASISCRAVQNLNEYCSRIMSEQM